MDRWRETYARLRATPIGGLVSRLVWAAKGLMGRPVLVVQPSPPRVPPCPAASTPAAPDTRLQVALAASQALAARVQALEPPPGPARRRVAAERLSPPRTVSVVVSTLDRAPWLDHALCALAYQRHPAFEVIVVAGPCRDETADVLARHGRRVRTAACEGANLARSRNIGLRIARGDVVAFLDDDAVPEPDWLQHLCAAYVDPQVGGVGGFIRDHTGIGFQCKVVAADRFGRSAEVGGVRRARLDPPGPGVARYLSLTGTNSSFRRRALLEIGGFDEAYAYFLDETDVCLRLAEAGWRLAVAPQAEVHHAYAPNAQRRADRAPLDLFACVRSTAYFATRHAAGRHGLAAVADHLQAYADGLRHDTAWRRDSAVIDAAQSNRLMEQIAAGVTDGVRAALSGPRRLMDPATPAAVPASPAAHGWRTARIRADADRLRLCLLSQQYPCPDGEDPSPPGGVAVWTQALAQAMAAAGHEVSVLARATDGEARVRLESAGGAGVWVHRVAQRPLAGPPPRDGLLAGLPAGVARACLAAAEEVGRIAPRRRFDLVMGPLWDLEPAALLDRGAHPVAVSLHTACAQMIPFKPEWTPDYRRAHVDKIIAGERRLLARAPHVLANSAAAARDIAAALDLPDLPGRAVVIPHGLPDLACCVRPAQRRPGVEILFVGRLEPRKGVDVLLDAIASVLAAAPDARLTLIGEDVSPAGAGTWRDAFDRRCAGAPWRRRVRFEGALSRDALLARYAACDVVAVPSRYESFGLTALEAMVFAKPCVASEVGGLAEVVLHGETGLLVPPGDAGALAAALLRLVGDADLRRTLGAAGRRRYEARFTAAAMAQAAEGWFREIIAERRLVAAE